MVCIYCGGGTGVTNSRLQKRPNQVWRRRKCKSCAATFSTHEAVEFKNTLVVVDGDRLSAPLSRNKLFLSIQKSCSHRPEATADATALTDTVISKLLKEVKNGSVEKAKISRAILQTLRHFDHAAAVHYQAFHPETTQVRSN